MFKTNEIGMFIKDLKEKIDRVINKKVRVRVCVKSNLNWFNFLL